MTAQEPEFSVKPDALVEPIWQVDILLKDHDNNPVVIFGNSTVSFFITASVDSAVAMPDFDGKTPTGDGSADGTGIGAGLLSAIKTYIDAVSNWDTLIANFISNNGTPTPVVLDSFTVTSFKPSAITGTDITP